jgi:hypothetical protein
MLFPCEPPRLESQRGLTFPPHFLQLVTSRVSTSSPHALISRIPEMREVNGVLTPFVRRRVSSLSITWAHLVVLLHVPRAQLRHFTTSLPEALPPLYPDTRSAEIPNSSLLLIATRDFGIFGTKVSTSYPPICRNAEF